MNQVLELLRQLQRDQQAHDRRAHRDIFYLPYPRRMKHLALHVAKYAGRLADPDAAAAELHRTLVDTFIIALSATDVLNLDYAVEFRTAANDCADLAELGTVLQPGDSHPKDVSEWFFRELARIGGVMGKACESLDHMEAIPYREMLAKAVLNLTRSCLVAGSILGTDLRSDVRQRWDEIEANRCL